MRVWQLPPICPDSVFAGKSPLDVILARGWSGMSISDVPFGKFEAPKLSPLIVAAGLPCTIHAYQFFHLLVNRPLRTKRFWITRLGLVPTQY